MRCPKCGESRDRVVDSRSVRDGTAIRRRRICLSCGHRFTTYEEVVRASLRVIKRDGRHEELSRQKLVR
ncbi:MAG TPA: transcriptional regulator NrdR, partial [Lentisphaerae bacterium]|nr:transcriptional regulator NrdR [Lentisphaerota bacterium]